MDASDLPVRDREIAVLLPCYNEAQTIGKVIFRHRNFVLEA